MKQDVEEKKIEDKAPAAQPADPYAAGGDMGGMY